MELQAYLSKWYKVVFMFDSKSNKKISNFIKRLKDFDIEMENENYSKDTIKYIEVDTIESKAKFCEKKKITFYAPIIDVNFIYDVKSDTIDVYANEEKKTMVLKFYDEKYVIKCDEDDNFDYEIGLGLLISKLKSNNKRLVFMRELLRNKKRQLDYKKYSKYVLFEFFNYRKDKIEDVLKQLKENGKVEL